jgi:hypothetical protein
VKSRRLAGESGGSTRGADFFLLAMWEAEL